ncbi:MAG: oxygenase MpaB family protein, partial [Thermomicrobiales bacterium]
MPTGLPPQVQRYFEESSVLPGWADPELMAQGRTLLGRYENSLVSTLLCHSLVAAYSCGKGAHVLGMSQRLTSGVYRRLMETSQFLVDVLDKDGLGAGGKGMRSAQKIRLLHATMRYHLSQREDWDSSWGLPVNQEDLAGTLLTFSVLIPRGLDRLGIDLAPADRDAFFHIWRVIGHVLGVDPELNATEFDSGSALWDTILSRQQSTTEDGIALTKGVLDFIRDVLPGPLFAGLGPTLIRHLAGDKTADTVAVPPADYSQLAVTAGSALNFGVG